MRRPLRSTRTLTLFPHPSRVLSGFPFVAGGILRLLGPVQLIGPIRRAAPRLHRWLGRLYVGAAAIAGVGGLGFILVKGTIGGTVMDIGFAIYGALMILRSEEHTSELQSLMRISYAVFCLKKNNNIQIHNSTT